METFHGTSEAPSPQPAIRTTPCPAPRLFSLVCPRENTEVPHGKKTSSATQKLEVTLPDLEASHVPCCEEQTVCAQ